MLHNCPQKAGGRGLSVRSGDRQHIAPAAFIGQFNLTPDL